MSRLLRASFVGALTLGSAACVLDSSIETTTTGGDTSGPTTTTTGEPTTNTTTGLVTSGQGGDGGQGGMTTTGEAGGTTTDSTTTGMGGCGDGTVDGDEECDPPAAPFCTDACKTVGKTCDKPAVITAVKGTQVIVTGTTVGGGSHYGASCGSSTAPDAHFRVTSTGIGFVTVYLSRPETDFKTSLYAGRPDFCKEGSAGVTESGVCADNGGNGGEVISFAAPSTVDVFVDGEGSATSGGNFKLVVEQHDGTCADPAHLPLFKDGAIGMAGDTSPTTVTNPWDPNGNPPGCFASGRDVIYKVDTLEGGVAKFTATLAPIGFNGALGTVESATCPSAAFGASAVCSNAAGLNQNETLNENKLPALLMVSGNRGGGGTDPNEGPYYVELKGKP